MSPSSYVVTSSAFDLPSIPAAAAPVVRQQTAAETPGAYQTFEAAKRGGFRGWFYFPNLDPRKQLDTWTNGEICRKTSWLYNNVGVVKSIVHRRLTAYTPRLDACQACGMCVVACPEKALTLRKR